MGYQQREHQPGEAVRDYRFHHTEDRQDYKRRATHHNFEDQEADTYRHCSKQAQHYKHPQN